MRERARALWTALIGRFAGSQGSPLLPADARQARPLMIVVAVMCALGCLAALTARAGFRAADAWTTDLRSAMTVLVTEPRDDASLARAADIVRGVEGVNRAEPMSRERAKDMLRNYRANIGPLLDELPVPRLIEVGVDGAQRDVADRIGAALVAGGVAAEVDDHSRYAGEIVRASSVLRGAALIALVSLIGAAVASIAFAARAALETRRDAVEILHLVGSRDDFVATEVQARFMRLGMTAGGLGALAAGLLAVIALAILTFRATGLTGGAPLLHWSDVWILLAAPLVTGAASAWAARIAARATLRELV